MYISQKLRKSSIAEYLLYMWQVEDIIRAYSCNITLLRREYISRFDLTEEQAEEVTDWWANLVRMMNQEGCREKGHLQINRLVIQQMNELHVQLLESPKFPFYSSEYYKVLPYIVELRNRGSKEVGEIETCMNALYGKMMLGLQNKELTPETKHAIDEITIFIGMLSDYFQKEKEDPKMFD